MKKAYFGSRFSKNMTRTGEGFLICHNVPLARTGVQHYLGSEVNKPEKQVVNVYRNENEVFSAATLASFEGKPVTDNHPPEFVAPENATGYMRGVVQNIRRGKGEESDLIIGDLVIHDAMLIEQIKAGKREVSAGYYCEYKEYEDGLEQSNIICNHVAVVNNGRAGSRVAIKDSKSVDKKGGHQMSQKNVFDRMLEKFMKADDTTTDDIKEAVKLQDSQTVEKANDEKTELQKEVSDALAPIIQKLEAVENRLKAMDEQKEEETKDEDEEALDALESELEGKSEDSEEEESITVEPESIDEDKTEDEEKAEDEEEEDEDKEEANDSQQIALRAFKAIKPIISQLPKEQRKQATDSLREALLPKRKKATKNVYADMLHRKAQDSKSNLGDFGAACRKFNPHIKK